VKIQVVGGGGREHALAWALHRNGENEIIAVPGNPGTEPFASNISGDPVSIAVREKVDLAVVGPEAPLVDGIAGRFAEEGIPCFGPSGECAMLEGSKWFAKEIMTAAGVPTAEGRVFSDPEEAIDHIGDSPEEIVIKADGLAAGKGVFLPSTVDESSSVLRELFRGSPGATVVVERRLSGREVSVLAVCNGHDAVMLPPSRDHKRAYDGDRGPNTGGMGAVCPPPDIPPGFTEEVRKTVILPVLEELLRRGLEFRGVLYAGLMLTSRGPMVLEFNVRFGDPETQAVLPLVESSLANLFLAAARGEEMDPPRVSNGASACVILASGGYPGNYSRGLEITGVQDADCLVFHAGTSVKDGSLVTSGGRVLGVTAVAPSLDEALSKAYGNAEKIGFQGKHMRTDIGRTL
jgi:phosphoribosylamine--glycine ligase